MAVDAAVLAQLERELTPPVTNEFPGVSLFHYTDSAGLIGILQHRQIWATHYRYLNDAAEMDIGETSIQSVAEELSASDGFSEPQHWLFESFSRIHRTDSLSKAVDVYVASFSEHDDDLSQWRAYGTDGAGYALGISSLRLPTTESPNPDIALGLVKCEYDQAAFCERVRDILVSRAESLERYATAYAENEQDAKILGQRLVLVMLRYFAALVPRLKHRAFAAEREWRLIALPYPNRKDTVIQYRPGDAGLIPYIPVDLAEDGALLALTSVVVGPTIDATRGLMTAKAFIEKLGYADTSIARISGIPYRGRR